MRWDPITFALVGPSLVLASLGNRLVEYRDCYESCYLLTGCVEGDVPLSSNYEKSDFTDKLKVNAVSKALFLWDCESDCHYKCQQYVTAVRASRGERMVKFYGKWPFIRVLGVTELVLVFSSVGNFYANFHNLRKVRKYVSQNRGDQTSCDVMATQYLALLVISCIGWSFSIIFHVRDLPVTETLDYFGAGLIMVATLNVIVVRFFKLFTPERTTVRRLFQLVLAFTYVSHIVRLCAEWDYSYNMMFNVVVGLTSLVLWVWHLVTVGAIYLKGFHVYNNSIQLLPYENRILLKLTYLNISRSRLIPYVPIALNAWMLLGILFEVFDFEPIWRLIDAHSLWHMMTIFPVVLWYDWNLWDLELYKIRKRHFT